MNPSSQMHDIDEHESPASSSFMTSNCNNKSSNGNSHNNSKNSNTNKVGGSRTKQVVHQTWRPKAGQPIYPTMDRILSIQNLSSVIYPEDPHMQMQLQLQLQELQRPHQQAPLTTSPLDTSAASSILSHLHNGSLNGTNGINVTNGTHGTNGTNGINGTNGTHSTNGTNNHNSSMQTNSCSRNSSFAFTEGHGSMTNGESSEANEPPEKELIDLVTCKLCKGYLIDAATLDLCMHTFCRACAVKYIRERPRCPECNIEIKDKRFLNRLKTDTVMQSIVYKVVPGLYEKEMARRRNFYAARPTPTPRYPSEMFGNIPPAKTIKPDDMMNISLTWLKATSGVKPLTVYFYCRADTTMSAIKKLIIGKFGLDKPIKIYYGATEISFDLTALMDVAAQCHWNPENDIMNYSFTEQDHPKETHNIMKAPIKGGSSFLTQTNPAHVP